MNKVKLIVGLYLLSTISTQAIVTVSNVSVAQREGTKLVDIVYDVSSDATNMVVVSLAVNNDASPVLALNVSGDIGASVSTGTGKSIRWDAGVDWSDNMAALTCTITADDGSASVTATCPLAKTGQTSSYRTGDDGDTEAGVSWPSPRFTNLNNETILDNLTGLEWVKAPRDLPGGFDPLVWTNAIDFCSSLDFADHTDWRLPTRKELVSLIDYGRSLPALPIGNGFSGVSYYDFWTSTSVANYSGDTENYAIRVEMIDGDVIATWKFSESVLTWPVRSRSTATAPAPAPKTGQTTIYRSGDDGDLQSGAAWPDPRFADNGNGVVTDRLTGLEWLQQPHIIAGNSGVMNWNSAIDFCNSLDYAGHTDWRLPNVKEMESLVYCGQGDWGNLPYEWLNSTETPFSGVLNAYYWTGTSSHRVSEYAWYLRMDISRMTWQDIRYGPKTSTHHVWPVRTPLVLSPEPATADVDTRDYALTVISDYGTPNPAADTHTFSWHSTVTCSVDSVVMNGDTRVVCTGWNLTGQEPATGTTNALVLTLTNLNTELVWKWGFNYWLEVHTLGEGSVDPSGCWCTENETINLSASPTADWLFTGWSGDLTEGYTSSNTTLLVDMPKIVEAHFSDDADGDGLKNTNEWAIGSNPRKSDTDDDGFDDAFEVAKGLNPSTDDRDLISYITDHDDEFALYPSDVVLDVAIGEMLIHTTSSNAHFLLQLEQSENLQTWTNAGDAVEWSIPLNTNKQFMRVRALPLQ